MIAIPAIDLKDGKVVRLFQGKFEAEKVYEDEPQAVAKRFVSQGARRIHVVDLDGALGGAPRNKREVEAILKAAKVPVEVGGGIRSLDSARDYFEMGVSWVVLGTKACLDAGFLREALKEFGEKLIVGVDALDGWVATDGWTKVTKVKAAEFVKSVKKAGGKEIIYTDISKDGAMKGPNLKGIESVCRSTSLSVVASGGVGSLDDLKRMKALGLKNLTAVIIGKALYENKFDLKSAIAVC